MQSSRPVLRSKLLQGIEDVLFPWVCPACEMPMESSMMLCPDCYASLARTEQASIRGNITEQLFLGNRRFQRGAAYLFFDDSLSSRRLIHAMKYRERPELARFLAAEAAMDMMCADFFDGIDLIMPVPLYEKRERERGFNQSEWIARGLSEKTGIPVDTKGHLVRVRDTGQQALLSGKDREKNMEGAFVVNHPEDLAHKHVLLVDDVITTGATVRACMDALKSCRTCEISVFSLGKAV